LLKGLLKISFLGFAFSFILTTIAQNGLGADKGMVSAEIPPPGCFMYFYFQKILVKLKMIKRRFRCCEPASKSLQGGEEAVVELANAMNREIPNITLNYLLRKDFL